MSLRHLFPDSWLQRWLPLAQARAGGGPALEIGCGHGDDTATLAKAGLAVVAIDRSPRSVALARSRVPSATVLCRDLREPFPEEARDPGVVVASLSLHYFGWDETLGLAERIRHLLRPGGVLLCRLNSTEDHHFGASGHPEIEPNFYRVDGEPKRFFDRAAVEALFADGWNTLSLEHHVTRKYVRSKALWEAIVERAA
jgi:SAM-dependent methyltransferase